MLFELGFEALEQRERVRRATGKSGQYPILIETPHFSRARLDDDVAQCDLTVSAERNAFTASDGKNGRAM